MGDASVLHEDLWQVAVEELQATARTGAETFGGRLFTLPGAIGVTHAHIPLACWVYEPTADLAAVIAACSPSVPRVPVNVVAEHPDQPLLLEAGWRVDEHVTEMVLLEPVQDVSQPPAGVTIEPVRVPDGVEEFHAAMARGFEAPLDEPEQWLPLAAISSAGVQLLVARDETGAVIGTAGLRRRGRGASLYAISVPPSRRGRGIGAALTARAAQLAFERGAALVQLQASSSGYPVYERAGFRAAGRWVFYGPPRG